MWGKHLPLRTEDYSRNWRWSCLTPCRPCREHALQTCNYRQCDWPRVLAVVLYKLCASVQSELTPGYTTEILRSARFWETEFCWLRTDLGCMNLWWPCQTFLRAYPGLGHFHANPSACLSFIQSETHVAASWLALAFPNSLPAFFSLNKSLHLHFH